jgi:YVTN family beta-propeller protein
MGTIDYVAPEQIRGDEVDGRADVYSLGCLLHECLTGRPPFSRDSDAAVLFAHLQTDPPAPPGLGKVLPRALAKDPDERFQSCGAFVEAARQALGLAGARRLHWIVAAAAGVAALVGAVLLAVFLTGGHSRGPVAQAHKTLDRLDARSGKRVAALSAGKHLTGIATGGNTVWLSDSGAAALIRVDASTHLMKTLPAQGVPYDVAAGSRFAATANGDNGTVAVFDATTGALHTIAHIAGPGVQAVCDVALDGSRGWATDCVNDRVVEFDADTGRVVRTVLLPPPVDNEASVDRIFADIAVGEGAIWVAGDALDPTLYRVNRATGAVVAKIRVPAGTVGVAVGAGSVWLTNQLTDSVTRIDPKTNQVVGAIPVGREPLAVAVGDGSVWTANALDRTVSRIDPSKGAVVQTVDVGSRPVAIAVGSKGVWVAEHRQ